MSGNINNINDADNTNNMVSMDSMGGMDAMSRENYLNRNVQFFPVRYEKKQKKQDETYRMTKNMYEKLRKEKPTKSTGTKLPFKCMWKIRKNLV